MSRRSSPRRRAFPAGVLLRGGGNVGKRFRGFRYDRLLPNPETDGRVRCDRAHDVGRVVRKGTAIPLDEPERGRRSNRVRKDVRKEPARNSPGVGPRIVGGAVGRDSAGDSIDDCFAIGCEIVGRTPGIRRLPRSSLNWVNKG